MIRGLRSWRSLSFRSARETRAPVSKSDRSRRAHAPPLLGSGGGPERPKLPTTALAPATVLSPRRALDTCLRERSPR
jgi:hypothetical protein